MFITTNFKKLVSIIVLLVMAISTFTVMAIEQPIFTVSSQQIYPGGEATITIIVDKGVDVSSLTFKLKYDSDAFAVTTDDVAISTDVSQLEIPPVIVQNGIISAVGAKASNVTLSGPFTVATIKFKATNAATVKLYPLELTVARLGTFIGDAEISTEIPSTSVNGNITIRNRPSSSSGGSSTPTPSPSPSPSPTPSASPSPTPQASEEPVSASGFVDVGEDVVWAEEAITELTKAGIISGSVSSATGKKVFEPNNKITRAEFAKLIVGAFNLPEATDDANYSDVKKDDWFFKVIATASKLGIVQGYDGGIFDPNKEITREEMCVMLIRAAKAVGLTIPEAELSFDDASSVSDFAISSIAGLAKLGIINGVGNNNFAPLNNATRAESAKVIYQIYKMLKALQ